MTRAAEAERRVRRRRSGARARRDHAHGQSREHHDLHDRPARACRRRDIDEQVDPQQWNDFVRKSQDSLRVLAEETGGIAVVNQNDFDKALKRIDAETSDYYVLGYYSKNPDASASAAGRSR